MTFQRKTAERFLTPTAVKIRITSPVELFRSFGRRSGPYMMRSGGRRTRRRSADM